VRGDHDILDCMEIDDAARAHFDELSKRNLTAFHVEKIAEALNQIPVAIYNRIQRERRRDLGEPLSLYLEMMVRVSGDTWRTARFLSSNRLDHGREVELLFAVPPLTRTILDALLTVIFMFDDPATNVRRYYAGAWRDRYEEHHQLVQAYGTDSAWATRLRVNIADIDQIAMLAKIRQEERDNLDRCLRGDTEEKPLVSYWPSPGKFGRSFQLKDPKRAEFVRHVSGFYYGALSQDSHLGFRGLQRRGGMYAQPVDGFDLDQHRGDCRTKFMAELLTIYSALLSELSCQLALDHEKKRLRDDVWAYLDHSDLDAAGLYKERYEEWLR
jgi:hypothetical protein